MDGVERRVDGVEGRVDGVEGRMVCYYILWPYGCPCKPH